jgi:hypothetical protein
MNTARWALDQHDGGAAGVDAAEHVEELLDDHRRQAQAQLVDQQQPGLEQERLGQSQHLLLAPAEVAGELRHARAQHGEQGQHRLGARGALGAAGDVLGGDADVLGDGEPGEDGAAARHQRHAALSGEMRR